MIRLCAIQALSVLLYDVMYVVWYALPCFCEHMHVRVDISQRMNRTFRPG